MKDKTGNSMDLSAFTNLYTKIDHIAIAARLAKETKL